jgi:hypothetical protein
MRISILIAVLLGLPVWVHAQSAASEIEGRRNKLNETNPDVVDKVEEKYGGKFSMIESMEKEAAEKVKERRAKTGDTVYSVQRGEVAGIWEPANDPDDKTFETMFDKRVFPSHLGFADTAVNYYHLAAALLGRSIPYAEDLNSLSEEISGHLSKRGQDALQDLRGKEINQLVCHSWGTEIVYNGILSGFILAPKEVFVLAAPDDNTNKWMVLAEKTGTIVHYVKSPTDYADMAAAAEKSMGVKADDLLRLKQNSLPTDTGTLERLWDDQCTKNPGQCHRFGRTALQIDDINTKAELPQVQDSNIVGHSRHAYIAYLRKSYPDSIGPSAAVLQKHQDEEIGSAAVNLWDQDVKKVTGLGDQAQEDEAKKQKADLAAKAKQKAAATQNAKDTLRNLARYACMHPGDWNQANKSDYTAACAVLQSNGAVLHQSNQHVERDCEEDNAQTLQECHDLPYAQMTTAGTASHYMPAPVMTPATQPVILQPAVPTEPLIQDPRRAFRQQLAASQQADKEALIADYQKLADMAYYLCENPGTRAYGNGGFCEYSSAASAIEDKYQQAGLAAPADYDKDTSNSDCGRALLERIFSDYPSPNLGCPVYPDGHDYDDPWVRQLARSVRRDFPSEPPEPSAQPSNPQPRRNPNPAPQGPIIPEGCHQGHGGIGCPPQSIP